MHVCKYINTLHNIRDWYIEINFKSSVHKEDKKINTKKYQQKKGVINTDSSSWKENTLKMSDGLKRREELAEN